MSQAPWYVQQAKGREGGPRFRFRIAGFTPLANKDIVTPAIPSPALIDRVRTSGRAEAWLAPDGGQWRDAALDRASGYEAEALAAAEAKGETVTVIAIWREEA